MGRKFIIVFLMLGLVFPICAKAYADVSDTGYGTEIGQLESGVLTVLSKSTIFSEKAALSEPCKYCCKQAIIIASQALTPTRQKAVNSIRPQRIVWPVSNATAAFILPDPPPISRPPHRYRAMLAISSRLLI